MNKPYDPKLREVSAEFKALCKKYDCMGSVLFVSPTHAEFINELSPTWSVMKIELDDGVPRVRFRSKRADFPSKEIQNQRTNATVHGVTSIIEWSRMNLKSWSSILDALRPHMTVLHSAWGDPDSVPGDGK